MHDHPSLLGRLQGNLQVLELLLRTFLLRHGGRAFSAKYFHADVGDALAEDPFTNADSLAGLVTKFNQVVERADGLSPIDPAVVGLHDALAHGRIAYLEDGVPARLLQFSEPADGLVSVTFSAVMNRDWFFTQIGLVAHQHDKVIDAARMLGYEDLIPTSESGD